MKLELNKKAKDVLNIGFLEALAKIRRFEKLEINKSSLDLTPKEMNYLALISKDVLKQVDLQQLLDISKGTLSNMVKLLAKKGYLVQRVDDKDRRVKRLILTPLGIKAVALNARIRAKIRAYILRRISSDELNTLMDIVLKIRGKD